MCNNHVLDLGPHIWKVVPPVLQFYLSNEMIRILTTDSVVSIQMSSSSAAGSAVGRLVRPVASSAMTTKCLFKFLSERCVNKSGN